MAVLRGRRGVSPPPDGPGEIAPSDGAYRNAVGSRIYDLVRTAERRACVVAWLTPSRVSESVAARPEDLRDYLAARYGDVASLQDVWGPRCTSFTTPTRAMAAESSAATELGLSMASLDVATCDALTHRSAVGMFVDAYARFDRARRPVVAGEETAFWALANLPDGLAGAVTGISLEQAPIDPATGNAVAVDVARAGGMRDALFTVDLTRDTRAEDLRSRIQAGLLHGARGVVLSDWRTAASDPGLAEVVQDMRETLGHFEGYAPANTVALIYQPMHAGARNAVGRPLYGLLDVPGWMSEPMAVLEMYGGGHRFGGIDVIPSQCVAPGMLSQYALVLAPQLYDVDEALARELWTYVHGGGVLYCDLGIASRQTGTFRIFPEPLIPLTGVLRIDAIYPMEADAEVAWPTTATPSLPQGARTSGSSFRGPVGDARVSAGARPALVIRARRDPARMDALYYAGVFANSFGAGTTIFSSSQCLGTWTPFEPLGGRFWGDLISRAARIEDENAPGLLSGDTEVRAGGDRVAAAHYGAEPVELSVRILDEPGIVLRGAMVEAGLLGGRVPSPTTVRGLLNGGEALVARYTPLRVTGPRVLAWVSECGADGMVVALAPADSDWSIADGGPVFHGGSPTRYDLEFGSGEMVVEPGDQFDVTVSNQGGRASETVTVTADEDGIATIGIAERGAVAITVRPRG